MNADDTCGDKRGTYAGWNRHVKAGERPCPDCREANRIYTAAWRAKGGDAIDRARIMNKARESALWRLKDMHRQDFDLLVADEVRALKRTAAAS